MVPSRYLVPVDWPLPSSVKVPGATPPDHRHPRRSGHQNNVGYSARACCAALRPSQPEPSHLAHSATETGQNPQGWACERQVVANPRKAFLVLALDFDQGKAYENGTRAGHKTALVSGNGGYENIGQIFLRSTLISNTEPISFKATGTQNQEIGNKAFR